MSIVEGGPSSLKIKIAYVVLFFLFTGFLNTILRIDNESNITFFRVLFPLALLYLALVDLQRMLVFLIGSTILLVYGFIIANLTYENFNWIYYSHYFTLAFLFFITIHLVKSNRGQLFYNFLRGVFILMIILSYAQLIFKFEFPHTFYRNTVNIYYWVENDLSAALAIFIPLLVMEKRNSHLKLILLILSLYIIVLNGTRIALFALIFFFITNYFNKIKSIGLIFSVGLLILLFFFFKDFELGSNTLVELIVDPVSRIFTLDPYNKTGSIYDRTNAVIYGMDELKSTYGFGIGPGNANLMMEARMPNSTAESMHNFFLQLYVEFGWLCLLGFAVLCVYIFKERLNLGYLKNKRLIFYLITAVLISLSQSEGLFSNYYFFCVLFLSLFYIKN